MNKRVRLKLVGVSVRGNHTPREQLHAPEVQRQIGERRSPGVDEIDLYDRPRRIVNLRINRGPCPALTAVRHQQILRNVALRSVGASRPSVSQLQPIQASLNGVEKSVIRYPIGP